MAFVETSAAKNLGIASVVEYPAPIAVGEFSTGPSREPSTGCATPEVIELASPLDVEYAAPVPPNGGYGWVCALSVLIINAHTWGVNSSWAVILAHYSSNDTFHGATHLEYSLIGGLSISQALMVSPLVARVYRHFGMRVTLLIGAVLEFLGLFMSSQATQVWHLFLAQGVCFGWGMGFLYIPASTILPPWFSTRRSLAVGLATSGAGIGGVIYSLAANAGIEKLGVPWTYRILGLCTLAANLVSLALLREVDHRRGGAAAARKAARQDLHFRIRDFTRIEVLLVVFWGFTTELGYITLLYSLPSYATTIGLSATQGSIVNAVLNVGLALGRPALGWISDQLGRINVACSVTALCGIYCFALWIPAQGFALLLVFALLAGTICGTFWSTVTPILGEVVGMGRLGRIFSAILICMVLPTTFAEPVAMQIVDSQGGSAKIFLAAQIFVGCMFMAGAMSLFLLRGWKIKHLEIEGGPDELAQSISRLTGSGGEGGLGLSWLTLKSLFKMEKV